MFNLNLEKNKSYYMNIKHKIWAICLYNFYKKYKFHDVCLVFL